MSTTRIIKFIRRVADKYRQNPSYYRGFFGRNREIKAVYRARLRSFRLIREPLVLISQIQRSGGTLLHQLLDGHPELYSHHGELYIGHPDYWNWPVIDMTAPESSWYEMLRERGNIDYFQNGYHKYSKGRPEDATKFPFIMPPGLQEELFYKCLSKNEINSPRDVLDCYMTAYFNGLLNYQWGNSDKKFISAFTPRMSMYPETVKNFFRDYPDGKLISLVRKPESWYVSARKHGPNTYSDIADSIKLWIRSAQAMIENSDKYPEVVHLARFEGLLGDTESEMRHIADFLDIEFSECLLEPTFQGMPIKADSAFKVESHGILKNPVDRSGELSEDEIEFIEKETGNLYEKLLGRIESVRHSVR